MECGREDPTTNAISPTRSSSIATVFPVPRLLGTDEAGKRALFEDLGDLSLHSWLRFPHDADIVEALYRRVLDILVGLHGRASEHVDECPPLASRMFDYDHLRWKTTYFLERFVTGLRKARIADRKALDEDLHNLAKAVSSFLPAIIHRDFQSQNIMMKAGIPHVIDFQGARMAPPAYDLASILWDPYHRLDDTMRERLISYYIEEMKRSEKDFDADAFRRNTAFLPTPAPHAGTWCVRVPLRVEGQEVFPEVRPRGAPAAAGRDHHCAERLPGAPSARVRPELIFPISTYAAPAGLRSRILPNPTIDRTLHNISLSLL